MAADGNDNLLAAIMPFNLCDISSLKKSQVSSLHQLVNSVRPTSHSFDGKLNRVVQQYLFAANIVCLIANRHFDRR